MKQIIAVMILFFFMLTSCWKSQLEIKDEKETIGIKENKVEQLILESKKLYNQWIDYLVEEKMEEALNSFQQAKNKNPNNSHIYAKICMSYIYLWVYDKALWNCNKALELNDKNAIAFLNKGMLVDSLKNFDKALALKPDYALAYYNKWVVTFQMWDIKQSIENYNKVFELVSYSSYEDFQKKNTNLHNDRHNYYIEYISYQILLQSHLNIALIYKDQWMYAKGIEHLNILQKIDPNYVNAYNNKWDILSIQWNDKEAVEEFNRGLKVDPNNIQLLYNKWAILYKMKNFNQALDVYNKILQIIPNDIYSLFEKWIILNKKWKFKEAMDQYDMILILDSDYAPAILEKWISSINLWNIEEAKNYYLKAIKIDSQLKKYEKLFYK